MIITEQIEKTKSRSLNKWLEIVTMGVIKAPVDDKPEEIVAHVCNLCEDTGRTQDYRRCLCYYESLNEDGYDF